MSVHASQERVCVSSVGSPEPEHAPTSDLRVYLEDFAHAQLACSLPACPQVVRRTFVCALQERVVARLGPQGQTMSCKLEASFKF